MLQIVRILRANLHQLNTERSKISAFHAKRSEDFDIEGRGCKVTISRLDKRSICWAWKGHQAAALESLSG